MKHKNSSFAARVCRVVAAVPKGGVLTYKQVAELAGSPGASRAVGTIMAHNTDPGVPCHRVVRSDGFIGGYRGGAKEKLRKLEEEQALQNNPWLKYK